MVVKFRDLVNSVILNQEKWIGFFGDSEYRNTEGEMVYGHWVFVGIAEKVVDDNWNLDDSVLESDLQTTQKWEVENDNGTLCVIALIYGDACND